MNENKISKPRHWIHMVLNPSKSSPYFMIHVSNVVFTHFPACPPHSHCILQFLYGGHIEDGRLKDEDLTLSNSNNVKQVNSIQKKMNRLQWWFKLKYL